MAEKCVFIGYSLEQKGYRCYNPVTCEIKVSNVRQLLSLYFRFYKVTMLENTNATGER
jgi:hypothetical protein